MTALVLRGDARHLPLPDASVDLIVTSPPYWGMRSYTDDGEHYDGQIGDEPTPGEYINNLLTCTQEWVRVLKATGSLFVNLGDKYSDRGHGPSRGRGTSRGPQSETLPQTRGPMEKSLLGLPWRYALACTDQLGLILRRDQIWHKTSALPESVTDRTATRHEYLFHLTKQERYYSAVDLIREPSSYTRPAQATRATPKGQRTRAMTDTANPLGRLPGSVWEIASEPLIVPDHVAHARCCNGRKRDGCEDGLGHYAAYPTELVRRIVLGWSPSGICTDCGEGRRPVVKTDGKTPRERLREVGGTERHHGAGRQGIDFKGSHNVWRTFSITGEACVCTPYTDHPGTGQRHPNATGPKGNHRPDGDGPAARPSNLGLAERVGPWREYHFDRWTPAPTRPSVVVDPFGGTGTTALVATALGRTGITIDRSADYCRLATWRTTDPAQLAKAMRVPKPPIQKDGQGELDLFSGGAA